MDAEKKQNKMSPLFASKSSGGLQGASSAEGLADVVVKLYSLFDIKFKEEKEDYELNKDFETEKIKAEETRNKELINAILGLSSPVNKETKTKEPKEIKKEQPNDSVKPKNEPKTETKQDVKPEPKLEPKKIDKKPETKTKVEKDVPKNVENKSTPQAPKETTKTKEPTATKEASVKPKEPAKETIKPVQKNESPLPKKVEPVTPKNNSSPIKTLGKAAVGVASAAGFGGSMAIAYDKITKEEGLPAKGLAYKDGGDEKTQKQLVSIGYGHQIKPDEYKQGFIDLGDEKIPLKGNLGLETVLTKEQSKKLFAIDLPKYEKKAKGPLGDSWEKLNDKQKAALISYAYNVGSTESLVEAGIKPLIDSGDFDGAAKLIEEKGIRTFNRKDFQPLIERRRKESRSFLGLDDEKPNRLQSAQKENNELKESKKQTQAIVAVNNTTNTTNNLETNATVLKRPNNFDKPVILL